MRVMVVAEEENRVKLKNLKNLKNLDDLGNLEDIVNKFTVS